MKKERKHFQLRRDKLATCMKQRGKPPRNPESAKGKSPQYVGS